MHQEGQSLAINFGRLADTLPAIFNKLPISLGISRRTDDDTIFDSGTMLITGMVQRFKNLASQFSGLLKHCFDQLGSSVFITRQRGYGFQFGNFINAELHVLNWGQIV